MVLRGARPDRAFKSAHALPHSLRRRRDSTRGPSDPDQIPIDDSCTLDALVDGSVSSRRFTLQLLGAFTASALVGTRMLGSLLYGVEPTDPVTFVSMIAVLLAVAFVSGLIPAIRASRTDSASALRSAT